MAISNKLFQEVAKMFNSFASKAEVELQATYKDSELNISGKAVGGKVEVIGSDGSLSPIPDGDYQLEDGTPFKVKDGVIVEWNCETQAPIAEDKPAEEMADAPVQEAAPIQDKSVADLQAEIDALKAETESIKKMIEEWKASMTAQEEAMASQFKTQLDELNSTLKTLATTPAEFSKTSTNNIVKDSYFKKTDDLKSLFGLK